MATRQELRKKYNYNPSSGQATSTSQPLTRSQLREKHGYTPPPEPEYPNGIQQFHDTAVETGRSLVGRGKKVAETMGEVGSGELHPLRGSLRIVGQAAGAAGDVLAGAISATAKAVTPAKTEEKIKKASMAILDTKVGQAGLNAIKSGMESYGAWKQSNPDAAEDLEAVVNIGSLFPVERGVTASTKYLLRTAPRIVGAAEKTKDVVTQTGKIILGKTPEKMSKESTSLAGKALQPKTAYDAKLAEEGLKYVDLTNVRTYDELVTKTDKAISDMAETVTRTLDADPTPYMKSALGENSVFIEAALNDMRNVYGKVRSMDDVKRVNSMIDKYMNQGLTRTEINNIAKEYGTTFKNKAFKSNGEPSTSWSGEGFENTRKEVKQLSRDLMPDETTKNLDEAMSKVYTVKEKAKDLSDAVMRLENKTVHQNVLQKAVGMFGSVLQSVGLKEFLRKLIPGLVNVGDETLSAVDLDKLLGKTLKRFQKINGLNGDALAKELISLAEESASNTSRLRSMQKALPPAPEAGTPKNPIIAQSKGQPVRELELKEGQLAVPGPVSVSGVTKATLPEPSKSLAKALYLATGKKPKAGDFGLEGANLFKNKQGKYFISRTGFLPTPISPNEAKWLEKYGYKFVQR